MWEVTPHQEIAEIRSRLEMVENLAREIVTYLADERLQPSVDTPDWERLDAAGRELCAQDFYDTIVRDSHLASVKPHGWLPKHRPAAQLEAQIWRCCESSPFRFAERRFLFLEIPDIEPDTGEYANVVTDLTDDENGCVEVLSGGQVQVVSGPQLFRRWWAWRRGVDEFAINSTQPQYRAALRGFADLVLTTENGPLPSTSSPPHHS